MIGIIYLITTGFTIIGKGPMAVFSSGLYGIMPPKAYSLFLNNLMNDHTIIISPKLKPTLKNELETYCEQMKISEFVFISHSSFDHTILDSKFCKKAFLLDPVSLPRFFFKNRKVTTAIPTTVIKSEFSYKNNKTNPFILPGFSTNIQGDIKTYKLVAGHIDILDDFWANLGRRFRIYSMYDNNKKSKRSEFRAYVSNIIKNVY